MFFLQRASQDKKEKGLAASPDPKAGIPECEVLQMHEWRANNWELFHEFFCFPFQRAAQASHDEGSKLMRRRGSNQNAKM